MIDKYHAGCLRDLGEHGILDKLILPRFQTLAHGFHTIGDDCAVITPPTCEDVLVWTTDPCPTPVQCLVDTFDMSAFGRFTVLINVSDIAAMGARPIGLLVSTVMREDMLVSEYERFLDGLREAAKEWDCPILGGNIKDGQDFTANGTALGVVKKDLVLRRLGAMPGDRICVIGEMGLFWAAVLSHLNAMHCLDTEESAPLEQALRRPVPYLREGQALASTRRVTCCMDSSDGVIGCLHELAKVNGLDFVLDSASFKPHPAVRKLAFKIDIDFRKLMLSWGDWNLVCTVQREWCSEVKCCIESLGTRFSDIGEVRIGEGRVLMRENGMEGLVSNFASKRFSSTSMFTHGLACYAESLQKDPLILSKSFCKS